MKIKISKDIYYNNKNDFKFFVSWGMPTDNLHRWLNRLKDILLSKK